MNEDHSSFERPADAARLWRYLDLPKYLSVLTTQHLWFSRADLLGDPLEGSMTHANVALRPELYQDVPGEALEHIAETRRTIVKQTYISCWHRSDHESAAMWALYGDSVAVTTTYERMRSAIGGEDHIYVGAVRYVDFKDFFIPEGNVFAPFLHKRRSFEHEREVRSVFQRIDVGLLPGPVGISVPVDVSELVECAFVSPSAPAWFADVVAATTKVLGFNFPTEQSELGADPVF